MPSGSARRGLSSHQSELQTPARQLPEFDWFDARLLTLVGWAVTGTYLLLQVLACFGRQVSAFDDCIPLVSADLINRGRRPVVDYHYLYGPFFDYLYAAAFRIVGRSVIVPRIVSAILYVAVSFQVPRFLRQRVDLSGVLRPLMTLLAAVSLAELARLPVWPACAFAILAVLAYPAAVDDPDDSRTRRCLFACGLLAGVSMIIRLNFGFYATGALLACTGLRIRKPEGVRPNRFRQLAPVATVALGAALPPLIFFGALYGTRALTVVATMITATRAALPARFIVLSPRESARLLLLPFLYWVTPAVIGANRLLSDSLIAVLGGVGLLVLAMVERGSLLAPFVIPGLMFVLFAALALWRGEVQRSHVAVALLYAAAAHYWVSRAEIQHAQPLLALQGLLFLLLLDPSNTPQSSRQTGGWGRGAAAIALLTGVLLYGSNPESMLTPDATARGARLVADWIRHPGLSDSDRVQGRLGADWQVVLLRAAQEEAGELKAAQYVASHTQTSDTIFVGAQDNSRIFDCDLLLYWLSARPPGTSYYLLDAGVASTAAVQDRIIGDLERNRVNWALLEDQQGQGDPSFRARLHAESKRLDEFFVARFEEVARFGRIAVWRRAGKESGDRSQESGGR
jgi:hypothetical protein